jgi:hypothetical protein
MQSRIEQVDVGPGETIEAEIRVADAGGDATAFNRLDLADATESIHRIGSWVYRTVHDGLPRRPQKVGVEFGLKFAIKSGKLTSVLAEASGEASLVVRLEWEHDG